jgi:hypothetical protein
VSKSPETHRQRELKLKGIYNMLIDRLLEEEKAKFQSYFRCQPNHNLDALLHATLCYGVLKAATH